MLALLVAISRLIFGRAEEGAPQLALAEVRGVPRWRRFLAWTRRRQLVRLDVEVEIQIPQHAGGGSVKVDGLPPCRQLEDGDGIEELVASRSPWKRDPLRPLIRARPAATTIPSSGTRTKR